MGFNKSVFAKNLRARRAELDMTQIELAKQANLSQSAIFQYEDEAQVPGADKVVRLADALGVTPNYLMGWPK
jgi:transcriptional regulator with XRE-family HTH domain